MGEIEDSTWSPIRDPNNPLPPPCSLTKQCEGKLLLDASSEFLFCNKCGEIQLL
eukprot:g43648.t1